MPDKKILINEVLSSTERTQYKIIKNTAKNLGFKFVWYNNGDFLVRWRNNTKTHSVRTESDLLSIIQFIKNQSISESQPLKHPQIVNRNRQNNDTAPNTSK